MMLYVKTAKVKNSRLDQKHKELFSNQHFMKKVSFIDKMPLETATTAAITVALVQSTHKQLNYFQRNEMCVNLSKTYSM